MRKQDRQVGLDSPDGTNKEKCDPYHSTQQPQVAWALSPVFERKFARQQIDGTSLEHLDPSEHHFPLPSWGGDMCWSSCIPLYADTLRHTQAGV